MTPDHIDILLVHDIGVFQHGEENQKHFKDLSETGYKAMDELRNNNVVKAIGLGVNENQVCLDALEIGNWDVFLLAGRYTLLEQTPLDSLFPKCKNAGTSIICGGPFNSGVLVGREMWNYANAPKNVVDKVNISTTGNAIDWADLNYGTAQNAAYGSRTFGVFAGGYDNPVRKSNVDYVTIASGGTATAGGTLTTARNLSGAGASSQTRGLHIGGYVGPGSDPTYVNVIDYTTISAKSAAVDFGDLVNKNERTGSFASPTRAINCGGAQSSPDTRRHIDYLTISTLGNTSDFGTLQELSLIHI